MTTEYRRCVIVGTGGVGFYLATALNRSLPHGMELICYDADSFEGGLGHSRLPRVSNAATKKVAFLRGFTTMVMGDKPPTVFPVMFDGGGDQCQAGDLVVDCSDMPLDKRKLVWTAAKDSGADLVRVSYDGLNETVVVAQGLPLMSGSKPGNYRSVPGLDLSMAAGGIGAIVIRKILAGEVVDHVEFQISINEFLGLSTTMLTQDKGSDGMAVSTN